MLVVPDVDLKSTEVGITVYFGVTKVDFNASTVKSPPLIVFTYGAITLIIDDKLAVLTKEIA